MSDDDSDVEPSGDIVVGLFLGTGIAFSFREREGNHLRKQSMPVVSSPLPRFEKPLLYTELGMVSILASRLHFEYASCRKHSNTYIRMCCKTQIGMHTFSSVQENEQEKQEKS